MTTVEPTARLEDWYFDPNLDVVVGRIFDDTKGRFNDGDLIRTSRVTNWFVPEGAKVATAVTTRNSVYSLGNQVW